MLLKVVQEHVNIVIIYIIYCIQSYNYLGRIKVHNAIPQVFLFFSGNI